MATHSSILAWRILWTEEPGGLQSMGSPRCCLAPKQQPQCMCLEVYTIEKSLQWAGELILWWRRKKNREANCIVTESRQQANKLGNELGKE